MTDEPSTPAIAALEASGVPFRVLRTEIARSAEESAAFQGIPVGSLLRSIVELLTPSPPGAVGCRLAPSTISGGLGRHIASIG